MPSALATIDSGDAVLAGRIDGIRAHLGSIGQAMPKVVGALTDAAARLYGEMATEGTYDSDLEKARKSIKKIGQDLAADTEMGPQILEPLKMQGIEQFGDFAIQIRMKMMTRPGEQFVIRRKAYALIKTAFHANGLHFAFPTVRVAGGTDAGVAAAAQNMLDAGKMASV